MKSMSILFFVFAFILASNCQEDIIYDLDSYKRVDGEYRTTFITPNTNINYTNVVNAPNQLKNYNIGFGGVYRDNQIVNDRYNQKNWNKEIDFTLSSGTAEKIGFIYEYESENRSYNEGMQYFMSGFYVRTNSSYDQNMNMSKRYSQLLNMNYDLGFGFGRIEVVNDAWIGARILEELRLNNLLTEIPAANEMKEFFDLVGDLSFDRVMDNRLRSIYQIEKLIDFTHEKGWIEKGSIPAFATIYDAFRFENFLIRKSGERLEFTLTPLVLGTLVYDFNGGQTTARLIQPGFEGSVEYEIDRNGDLEYYTTKLLGGRIGYRERYTNNDFENFNTIIGNAYFEYQYNYLPSLRTNLMIAGNINGGFIQNRSYTATLTMSVILRYRYYFSPATQLFLETSLLYRDSAFQIGDYQPQIKGAFSMNVVHAIR